MNRRTFIKVVGLSGAAVAAQGLLRESLFPVRAQAGVTPAVVPSAVPGAVPGAVSGVTADSLRLGMSAPFSGSSIINIGIEYYRGARIVFDEVNANGGVFGRQIELAAYDDNYVADLTIANTRRLLDEGVYCLFNYVGSPNVARVLPIIKLEEPRELVLVGNYTGAMPQRQEPYINQIFNIRPSYPLETNSLATRFWEVGFRRIGVFYQIDAFGRSGEAGVVDALRAQGSTIAAETTYPRGVNPRFISQGELAQDMRLQIDYLRNAGVDAVVCSAVTSAYAPFIMTARDLGWDVPIANLSVSDDLIPLLQRYGLERGRNYLGGLINTQVVPNLNDTSLPGVQLYRDLMDKWAPPAPAGADPNFVLPAYSSIGLEAFINARVLLEALRRAGTEPTRAGLREALESMVDLDFGIGAPVSFGPGGRQGLQTVYFTYATPNGWTTVTDWNDAVRVTV